MNVRVAVRAILSYVGEDWLYMALDALYLFVHAAQRILRLVVIKLRHRAVGRQPAAEWQFSQGTASGLQVDHDRIAFMSYLVGHRGRQVNHDSRHIRSELSQAHAAHGR